MAQIGAKLPCPGRPRSGRIRGDQGKPVTPATPPITEAQAVTLLMRDMAGAAQDVAKRVTAPLLAREAEALISWTYNLGDGSLRASTLLVRLNAGDKAAVPAEMRKWVRQNGKPLVGLLRHRWAQAAIFTGLEPMNACVRAWKDIEALTDWPPFDA